MQTSKQTQKKYINIYSERIQHADNKTTTTTTTNEITRHTRKQTPTKTHPPFIPPTQSGPLSSSFSPRPSPQHEHHYPHTHPPVERLLCRASVCREYLTILRLQKESCLLNCSCFPQQRIPSLLPPLVHHPPHPTHTPPLLLASPTNCHFRKRRKRTQEPSKPPNKPKAKR